MFVKIQSQNLSKYHRCLHGSGSTTQIGLEDSAHLHAAFLQYVNVILPDTELNSKHLSIRPINDLSLSLCLHLSQTDW